MSYENRPGVKEGFIVRIMERYHCSREQAEEHWKEFLKRPFHGPGLKWFVKFGKTPWGRIRLWFWKHFRLWW